MGELQTLAQEIGADERTLRRAVAQGTLHVVRPTARSLAVDADERRYLAAHWTLLTTLRRALRTEPNVALAVLYGSTARGTDGPESDIDLLVDFRAESPHAASDLAGRLETSLRRDVDIARLPRVLAAQPLLVVQALDEGRVLVDRDRRWFDLHRQRPELARRAAELHEERRRRVARALERER